MNGCQRNFTAFDPPRLCGYVLADPIQILQASVRRDVETLRNHPLLIHKNAISGWIHQVETGAVSQVD